MLSVAVKHDMLSVIKAIVIMLSAVAAKSHLIPIFTRLGLYKKKLFTAATYSACDRLECMTLMGTSTLV